MPAVTSKKIVLRDNRFFLETTVQDMVDLGSQEFHLSSMIKPVSVFTPNFGSIGERHCHMMATPPGPGVAASWLAFTRLDKLPFRSAFSHYASGGYEAYIPTSRAVPQNEGEKYFKDSDFIFPASWGKCWFMTSFIPAPNNSLRPTRCFLFTTRAKECYLLSYPNVHANGLICMGRDWDTNPSGGQTTLLLQFMHCLTSFFSSDMNPDLTSNDTYRQFSRSIIAPNAWEYRGLPATLISNAAFAPLSGMSPNFDSLL